MKVVERERGAVTAAVLALAMSAGVAWAQGGGKKLSASCHGQPAELPLLIEVCTSLKVGGQ